MRSKRVLAVTLIRLVPRSESFSRNVASPVDGHDGALEVAGARWAAVGTAAAAMRAVGLRGRSSCP